MHFLDLQPGGYWLHALSIELEEIFVSWLVWMHILHIIYFLQVLGPWHVIFHSTWKDHEITPECTSAWNDMMINYITVLNKWFVFTQVKGEVESTYRGSQESSPHGQLGGSYVCNDAVAFAFNNTETYFEVNATFTDFRVQPFANTWMEGDFNNDGEYIILPCSVPFSANYVNFPYYLIPFA